MCKTLYLYKTKTKKDMLTFSGCVPDDLIRSIYSACATNVGQIQKAMIVHLVDGTGAKVKFRPNDATPTDPTLLATWTTLFALTGKGKPIETPWLAEPSSEAGGAITYGGGNATPNGVTIVIGKEKQPFSAKILSQDQQKAIKPLNDLHKSSGVGYAILGTWLVNNDGKIIMVSNGLQSDDPDFELYPIPIHAFFISDMTLGGLESPDNNMISWEFPPNWSNNLYIVSAEFNALDKLAPAVV